MEDTGESPKTRQGTGQPAPGPRVLVCANADEVARAAAERFVQLSRKFIAGDGAFRVALSGGNTPKGLYRLLRGNEFRGQVGWNEVHLFWGDERAVPPDNPESNYGMAERELLSRVPIPREHIHRMEAERLDLQQAAGDYAEVLRRCLPVNAQGVPRFDLIFLGLGTDGHTASLFPSWKEWQDTQNWVNGSLEKFAGMRRMTLTLPVLNAARHVIFMVTGEDKAGILRRVLKDPLAGLPAQHVRPTDGELLFLADQAAGARLNKPAR